VALLVAAGALVGCGRAFAPPVSNVDGGFAPLSAFAEPAVVAPRGIAHVRISGGSGGYTLDLRPSNTHSGGGAHVDDNGFEYVAGDDGNVSDVITVIDKVTQLSVDVPIAVGAALTLTPQQLVRAPLQTWSFHVAGGQPPYCFTIDTQGSDCGGVSTPVCGVDAGMACGDGADAGRGSCVDGAGNYQARSCGNGLDVVRVVDANGASFDAEVSVSTQLLLAPLVTHAPTGGSVLFQVAGGVPPYLFTYTPHGNRSGGAVGVAGDYVAGPNPDVVDEIRVSDAVGAQVVSQVQVGSPEVSVDSVPSPTLFTGDFNADGFPDVFVVSTDLIEPTAAEILGGPRGLHDVHPFALEYAPTLDDSSRVLLGIGDFNGDGTDDIAVSESEPEDNDSVQLLVGRRDGSFDVHAAQQFADVNADDMLPAFEAVVPQSSGTPTPAVVLTLDDTWTDGVRVRVLGFDADGHALDAGVFPIPSGASEDLALVAEHDLRLGGGTQMGSQVFLVDNVSSGSGCGSQGGNAIYPIDVDRTDTGGLALSYELPAFCVPDAQLRPVQAFRSNVVSPSFKPSFVLHDAYGAPQLALARASGSYSMVPIPPNPGADGTQVIPVALGATYRDELYLPEVDVLRPQGTERLQVVEDGGVAPRADPLPGGLASLVAADINFDHLVDVVTVDRAGVVRYQRGMPYGYLSTGENVRLDDYASAILPARMDGDADEDVLVADPHLHLLWGGPDGHLALGPELEPEDLTVVGMAAAELGAWIAVVDADGGVAVDRVSVVDGGVARAKVALPELDGRYTTPAQPLRMSGGDGALVRGYKRGGGGQIYAVHRAADGGDLDVVDVNAAFIAAGQGYSDFRDVVPVDVSGHGVDDLAVWSSDGFQSNVLAVYPATGDSSLGWAGQPSTEFDLTGTAGVDGWVTALFPFASAAGGSLDRLLLVVQPNDPDFGGCDAYGSTTFVLLGVEAGHLQQLDAYTWADTSNFWDDPCFAYTWTVGAGELDGEPGNDLILTDSNNVVVFHGAATHLDAYDFVTFGSSAGVVAAADVNGDGRADLVLSLQQRQPEVQVMLNHPDGTFH
jgi:hypothetical protein